MAVALALVSAVLFGSSAPLAKLLLGEAPPLVLAGLLYLGAGLMALPLSVGSRNRLTRSDWPLLGGAILAGGIVGPLLLLVGLERTAASTASLLLNLESVFTCVIAVALGERLGGRAGVALALVVSGAALVTFVPGGATASVWGPLAVAVGCLAWGVDNNLTQRLSRHDPLLLVRYKGFCAGAFSLVLGLLTGGRLPPAGPLLGALAVGAVGYGVSLTLFVRALRSLGAARTSMLFATAPLSGALLALLLLHERPSWTLGLGGVAMALGAGLLASETAPTTS